MPKNKNIVYIVTLIIIIAALGALGVFNYMLFGILKRTSAEITTAKKEVAAMQAQEQVVDDFMARYGQYEENIQKVSRLFIDSQDPVNFITFLEDISTDAGVVSSVAIAPAVAPAAGSVSNIKFQISVFGEFSDILEFSEKLEAGPYLANIVNFALKNVDSGELGQTPGFGGMEAYLVVEAMPK